MTTMIMSFGPPVVLNLAGNSRRVFLVNVCKTFLSQSAGKMSGRKRPAPAQLGIMDFFDAKKGKYQTTT